MSFSITIIYLCVYVDGVRVYPADGEHGLLELIPSFYHVCPHDQTQVIRLSNKCLYSPIYLNGLLSCYH